MKTLFKQVHDQVNPNLNPHMSSAMFTIIQGRQCISAMGFAGGGKSKGKVLWMAFTYDENANGQGRVETGRHLNRTQAEALIG